MFVLRFLPPFHVDDPPEIREPLAQQRPTYRLYCFGCGEKRRNVGRL